MADNSVTKAPAPAEDKAGKQPAMTKPKAAARPEAATPPAAPAPAPIPAAPVETISAAIAAPVIEDTKIMTDTIQNAADQTNAQAKALFGEGKDRAGDAMAKGQQAFSDMNEFAKGNVEALVESSKIAARGAQEIARYSADYGRKTIEQANENAKRLAGVKSPTELFQLQSEFAKSAVEQVVAETSKFTESYLKLMGEIAQPLSNRVAVAVDKVKQAA